MQLANRAVNQTTTTVTLVKVRNYYSLLRKADLGFFSSVANLPFAT